MTQKKKPSAPSKPQWTPPLGQAGQPKTQRATPQRWAPHAYQKKAVKFLLERGAAALFLDPGLGKTSITMAALKVLKRDGMMRGCLVIAPLRPAKLVWPAERDKWEDFKGLSIGVLHGDKKMQVLQEDHDIYVTNHDTIPWLFGREKPINPHTGKPGKTYRTFLTPAGKLLMEKVNILVLDELSKFKHTDTERFKRIKPWLPKFDRRYGLTGSPASNGLLDLFGQCYALDGGRSLGQFVTYYRAQYFVATDKMGFNYRPKTGAEEEIYERVAPLALRLSAEDHMQLPQLRHYPIKLDLPPAVRSVYDAMENDLLAILANEILTAPNAASANMTCRQLCSGAVYLPAVDPITNMKIAGPRRWTEVHKEKLTAISELLEELQGQQVLIAYEFNHDLERLRKLLPDLRVFGESEKKDQALEKEWNAGTLNMVAGHPASIGHGLNLQSSGAHNIIWFTLTWDFELFDQYVRRLMRQGNTAFHVNSYYLMMRDSVEESVVAALRSKKRGQDAFLEAILSRQRL